MTRLAQKLRPAIGILATLAVGIAATLTTVTTVHAHRAALKRCNADAVIAGTVCVDLYEASVWRVPDPTTANTLLVRSIQRGEATRADLVAAGAVELGTAGDDYGDCRDDGQQCADDIYAVSLPSEIPSAQITWFQAGEACANSGKRLPTSAEWQVAADGTPDPGPDDGVLDCNSTSGTRTRGGERAACVSARGAFDMVGNVAEWTADWAPASTTCPTWGSFSNDEMCLAGASEDKTGPGVVIRGGWFSSGALAGPLAVFGAAQPYHSSGNLGFRCVR
ncbi:MAG TPA: SUMF1/EgtB/PvdO family nonheme iron enzyme [Candidatus Limnocylindrales bacterium]|nr:SUMF1/EgtB/PvdO family nonheme iron enzyme [Candidatus Limnocylindrales bacterium]